MSALMVAIQQDEYIIATGLVDASGATISQLSFTSVNWHEGQLVGIAGVSPDDEYSGRLRYSHV